MRMQNLPIILPNKGLNYDLPKTAIDKSMWSDGLNVRFESDHICATEGAHLLSSEILDTSGAAEKVLWLGDFWTWNGTQLFIAITNKRMYGWDATTHLVWDNIAFAAPANFNTTSTQFWSVALLNNQMFFTNHNVTDKILTYTGTGNITVQGGVTGCPTSAMILLNWANHLIALRTIETTTLYPLRVKWSDTNNPTVWNSGNAGSTDFTGGFGEKRGWIQNGAPLGNYLYIYTDCGIVQTTYVGGGTNNQFNFQSTPIEGVGLLSPRCLANISDPYNYHMILTESGLKAYFGGTSLEDIPGFGREVTKDIDMARLNENFSLVKPTTDTAEFVIWKTTSSTVPEVYKWNYKQKCVSRDEKIISCGGIHTSQATTLMSSSFPYDVDEDGSLETYSSEITAGLMSSMFGAITGNTQYVYGNVSGQVLVESDSTANWITSTISSYVDTPQYHSEDRYTVKKTLFRGIDVEAKWKNDGDILTILYSTDSGVTWTTIKSVTLTSNWETYTIYHRCRANSIIYRLSSSTANHSFPYIRAVVPKWIPMSSREEKK